MPPRKVPQAKKATKASTKATKASAPTFTPAQAKELEKLLKVQKEAEAAKEEAKKKATRKRSAAMLQEEITGSEEGHSSPAPSHPVSRTRKLPRILPPPPNQRKVLNSVTDVLNHNASGDKEGGLLLEVDAGPDVEEDVDAALGSRGEGTKDGEGEEEEEEEDQEVEVDDGESNHSPETRTSSSTTGKWKAKVNLSEFSMPRIHRIAQLGNRDMRRLGALEEAFPSATYKEDKCWEILTGACKPHSHLNSCLEDNKYLSFPDPLLAACASGLQCALKGFSLNGKLKGAGSVVAFTDENFCQECAGYVSLLGNSKTQTPSFYKLMKMDMLDTLIKMSSEAASMVAQSTTTMSVDMEALEESAKQLLAERGLDEE
ncbi:hypothetical protein DFH29DRAFT_1031100 [Suillus ampliporus]|nr:hypothetical protein DFH29DRAFT_1031100 [Suillus ampliporus]